jgi:hypothetical protein
VGHFLDFVLPRSRKITGHGRRIDDFQDIVNTNTLPAQRRWAAASLGETMRDHGSAGYHEIAAGVLAPTRQTPPVAHTKLI